MWSGGGSSGGEGEGDDGWRDGSIAEEGGMGGVVGVDWKDRRRGWRWWLVAGGRSSSAPSEVLRPRVVVGVKVGGGLSVEVVCWPVGLVSGRLAMRLFIHSAVVFTFWSSFWEGSSGSARTAEMRKRMSSRMEAVREWIRRASSQEENCTRGDMSGVLRDRRKGIEAASWKSNSLPPRRKGGVSNDRAMDTSAL